MFPELDGTFYHHFSVKGDGGVLATPDDAPTFTAYADDSSDPLPNLSDVECTGPLDEDHPDRYRLSFGVTEANGMDRGMSISVDIRWTVSSVGYGERLEFIVS